MKTLYIRLAADGIRRNRRFYLPFLLTAAGVSAVQYILFFLAGDDGLDKISGGATLRVILQLGSFVIAVFAALFLFYTHAFLTRRRGREFGLYSVLGMGKRSLAAILFWETLLSFAASLSVGLLAGAALAKLAELGHIRAKMDARLEELRHAGADPQTEKRLAETEFLLPLLLGTSDDFERDEVLYARAAEIGLFATPPKRFCVAVAKFRGADGQNRTTARHIPLTETILSKYISVCVFLVNGRVVIFAYSDKDNSENFRIAMQDLVQSAAKLYSETCTVGISRLFTSISQSAAAYFEAVTARRYSTEGATPLRYITDQEHGSKNEYEYIEKSVFRLEELLKVGTEEALASFLEELYRESNQRSSDYLVIQILATVYRTVSTVSQKEALTALVADNPIYARVGLAERSETVRDELRRLCMDARKIISGYRTQSSQLLCDRAVAIIEADYADESLTLTDVSARLAVSPNYLSALIKKNKGENFVSLLTACRMRHAYDLIVCSTMKILEVAERCGYSDQHYFSYCFKKHYGISPNKMRENSRSTDES